MKLGIDDLYDRAQQNGPKSYFMIYFVPYIDENCGVEEKGLILAKSNQTMKKLYLRILNYEKEEQSTNAKNKIESICSPIIGDEDFVFPFKCNEISQDTVMMLFRDCAQDNNDDNEYNFVCCFFDTLNEDERGDLFYIDDCVDYAKSKKHINQKSQLVV